MEIYSKKIRSILLEFSLKPLFDEKVLLNKNLDLGKYFKNIKVDDMLKEINTS